MKRQWKEINKITINKWDPIEKNIKMNENKNNKERNKKINKGRNIEGSDNKDTGASEKQYYNGESLILIS